jgi:PAS domain S-box-containing protein
MREKAAVVGGLSQYCELPGTKCLVARRSLIIWVLVLAASAQLSFAAQTSSAKTVLALYSLTGRKAQNGSETLRSTTRSHVGAPVNFRVEYLDSEHFEAPGYEKVVSELLVSVYGGKIDLVIAAFYPALRFVSLPHATIIWYQQPAAGARYGKYVVLGLVLIGALTLLVIGLLWQRALSQKGDLRLRESEKRFQLMADTIPTLVWMCDKEGSVTYLNETWIDFTGRDPDMGLGDVWSVFIHPEDAQSVATANALALGRQKGFSKEYRLRRRDGVYRWMLDIAAPRINGDGSFAGFIGSAVDITDQKLAREALEKIGGKLIEAQEEERSRIARELHDDICQRLALLSMELEQANRGANDARGWPNAKIEEIRRHCAEIAGDVQALSHKLHSSKLEYLGVVAAISSFCREFSQQYEVSVGFSSENVPGFLPRDVSLSLFRVTQEALHNAMKHSGVSKFSVNLRGTANEIQLEVRDRGTGFDVERAKQDRGLGLVSMQERVHLVHGIFSIESQMGGGTKILVRVPLVIGIETVEMQGTEA